MMGGKNRTVGRSRLYDLVIEGDQRVRPSRPAHDYDVCSQCHFAWNMHPERYDSDEKQMVRFCTEYPVEPVRILEACIGP